MDYFRIKEFKFKSSFSTHTDNILHRYLKRERKRKVKSFIRDKFHYLKFSWKPEKTSKETESTFKANFNFVVAILIFLYN